MVEVVLSVRQLAVVVRCYCLLGCQCNDYALLLHDAVLFSSHQLFFMPQLCQHAPQEPCATQPGHRDSTTPWRMPCSMQMVHKFLALDGRMNSMCCSWDFRACIESREYVTT